MILAIAKKALPEVRGEDLQLFLDECCGRCRLIVVWRIIPELRLTYRVKGQKALGRLRLLPLCAKEDGEEHWKGTFRWGPSGERKQRTVRLVGEPTFEFGQFREIMGK